jgi:ribosomal protein S27E
MSNSMSNSMNNANHMRGVASGKQLARPKPAAPKRSSQPKRKIKCGDCAQKQAFYGLLEEGKKRWCKDCATVFHSSEGTVADLSNRMNFHCCRGTTGCRCSAPLLHHRPCTRTPPRQQGGPALNTAMSQWRRRAAP